MKNGYTNAIPMLATEDGYQECTPEEASHIQYVCHCGSSHLIPVRDIGKDGPIWEWNLNTQSPTLSPSVNASAGKEYRCHHYLRNGDLDFLRDCTHAFAGKKLYMPAIRAQVTQSKDDIIKISERWEKGQYGSVPLPEILGWSNPQMAKWIRFKSIPAPHDRESERHITCPRCYALTDQNDNGRDYCTECSFPHKEQKDGDNPATSKALK